MNNSIIATPSSVARFNIDLNNNTEKKLSRSVSFPNIHELSKQAYLSTSSNCSYSADSTGTPPAYSECVNITDKNIQLGLPEQIYLDFNAARYPSTIYELSPDGKYLLEDESSNVFIFRRDVSIDNLEEKTTELYAVFPYRQVYTFKVVTPNR